MLERDGSTRPVAKCARCGAPATGSIWGHLVCGDCTATWESEPRFSVVEVRRAASVDAEPSPEARSQLVSQEYSKRMSAWIHEGRAHG